MEGLWENILCSRATLLQLNEAKNYDKNTSLLGYKKMIYQTLNLPEKSFAQLISLQPKPEA